MNSEIRKLIDLQEVDNAISRLREQLARYPELRKGQRSTLDAAQARLAEARQKAADLAKQLREAELEGRQLREAQKRASAAQFQVKNQKEYEANIHEVAELDTKIAAADERGLELLTREEDARVKAQEVEIKTAARERETAEELDRYEVREKEIGVELEALVAHRAQMAAGIDPIILEKYERLGGLHPNDRVVAVADGNCGGCFLKLLAHRAQSLMQDDKVNQCDSCHRFIYLGK